MVVNWERIEFRETPGLCHSHLGAVDQGRDIGGVGVAETNKAPATP